MLFERPVETLLCRILCSDDEMTTSMPMISRDCGQAHYPLSLSLMGSYRLHDCDSISCKNRLKDNLDYKKRSWALGKPTTHSRPAQDPLMGSYRLHSMLLIHVKTRKNSTCFHSCCIVDNIDCKKRSWASLPPTQNLLSIPLMGILQVAFHACDSCEN